MMRLRRQRTVRARLMESKKKMDLPTAEQLEQELKRLKYRHSFAFTLRSTVASLIVVAAIAVIDLDHDNARAQSDRYKHDPNAPE